MGASEQLAAILAAVQIDPGNRGLAKLFGHFPDDFANACKSIAETPDAACMIHTGFYIPSATPPAFETDGPLGVAFLIRALRDNGIYHYLRGEEAMLRAFTSPVDSARSVPITHVIAIERAGPAADGKHYTMRGRDISPFLTSGYEPIPGAVSIGIGDGGNEIGMGKLPHELVAANIPNGDLIHCRVPTDHLIVAGVSNWGAYALAAGIYALRGKKGPGYLFDPECERRRLEEMVKAGPLVDGVTGKRTATVDGLPWDEYANPLSLLRKIVDPWNIWEFGE